MPASWNQIVEWLGYRKANGSFKDFEAVKKVPDVDLKTLEAHRDAVAF